MLPDSIVILRVSKGWTAFIRYANTFFDQDVACNSRYELDRKIGYIVKKNEVCTRG